MTNTPQAIKDLNEIKSFLEENGIEYKETDNHTFVLHYGNPEGKRSYEICYIPACQYPIAYPKYNIEGVTLNYFYNLSVEAENNNSFKCWIKDYEWADNRKREVLKSYIMYSAGKITNKFSARDFDVKEVPTNEARSFESEHCFYGKRGASLNLGLYLKKEKHGFPAGTLMMIYTFGKNFFGKDNSIEILRVGTRKFCNIYLGASKLLNHLIKNYPTIKIGKNEIPVTTLKFYSDYDHNIGGSMDGLGFKFVNYSKGGFMNYWTETGIIKGREPVRHKWVMEQMEQGKVFAIPNAGVKTFVMELEEIK
jgi:hypothetical protein